jgi:sugar phosphate permease
MRGHAYRWYVVVICMIAYVFSYIDRQIMTLLIEPIQADLALSETQFGMGIALFFAAFPMPPSTTGIQLLHSLRRQPSAFV